MLLIINRFYQLLSILKVADIAGRSKWSGMSVIFFIETITIKTVNSLKSKNFPFKCNNLNDRLTIV